MKKSLLSVLAAGLVVTAVAPVALAADKDAAYGLGATRWSNESGVWADNNNVEATPAQIKGYNDADLGYKSEKWTRDANKLKAGEHLKVDKGQAAKDAAMAAKAGKAGVKALPKTSAVK